MTETTTRSDARSAIFAAIRKNLAASAPYDAVRRGHDDHSPVAPDPTISAAANATPVIDSFAESLELVGARCVLVENESDAVEQLRLIVAKLEAERVVISDSEIVRKLADRAGIHAIENASRENLFSSDVGITTAQWAIAETGTLVLESGNENHRLVSLVPPVHVCVLRSGSIRQTMAEILELVDTDTHRAITFITGASRTSDIELTLAIGVHGPGELHVLVIKDQ